ncbi:SDR family NAD(P)-dependent oxidoreductase [Mesobacterium sp. TK19101]|uniref:SDR family NAD(P)-dependent oxidoreductase n=1 Tax=Mesobacterium hydrothermale TaxID=3111907 RepID=A0ABU6HGT1_9RHOB|nr:SDR family NAD(P)-dependent oxidoreductase [Mesobacterium sp. TK19101]MEC3861312.1 SDR family NAD(P)-dependent oxidoreductase [Mesobacterium sp. TK19101]
MTTLTVSDGCVVLTGAGSGLGRAMAVALTARGFTVFGFGRTPGALRETHAQCHGGAFYPVAQDVADSVSVAEEIDRIEADHGPIALLINNAATYPKVDFLEASASDFMAVVNTNLGGMVNCSHAVLRHMAERGRGRVLNVATFADLNPLPTSSAYSVSKGAARILTRALVADLGDRFPDIVIGDWMPGMLKTRMGIPDGLPPEVSAEWGVALALWADPALNGTTFEQNTEVLPPIGLKGKIKALLTGKRRKPRVIG